MDAKEERRKKIMDRASDRMSIITNHSPNRDTNDGQNLPNHHLNSETEISKNEEVDDQASKASLKKTESESELIVLENTSKAKDVSVRPQRFQNRKRLPSFSPKRINACILSSENTRVVCSIMIALLVVFSNSNLPHHIIKERSIISRKPMFVLLFTDVSIVMGRIILAKRRGMNKDKKRNDGRHQEDAEIWEGAIKTMELGLVFYQVMRGIFIDCSFYMVIVTCGLSLL